MSSHIFEKKPAFFRVTSAEMFFEADTETTEDIQIDQSIEDEIDALIQSSQVANTKPDTKPDTD